MARDEFPNLSADPELLKFAEKVRGFIRQRVDHAHDEVRLSKDDKAEPARVTWTWIVSLGALAYDLSGSSLLLLRMGHIRAAVILNRVLMEYWIRLKYYKKNPAEAARDLSFVTPRFRSMLKADPALFSRKNWKVVDEKKFQEFLAQDEEFKNQQVRRMLEEIVPANLFTQYYKTYGLFSILVHGNELITLDVFRDFMSGSTQPRVDYQTNRYKPDDTALSLTHLLLDILQLVEEPFSGIPISADLRGQYAPIRRRIAEGLNKAIDPQPPIADVFGQS